MKNIITFKKIFKTNIWKKKKKRHNYTNTKNLRSSIIIYVGIFLNKFPVKYMFSLLRMDQIVMEAGRQKKV